MLVNLGVREMQDVRCQMLGNAGVLVGISPLRISILEFRASFLEFGI